VKLPRDSRSLRRFLRAAGGWIPSARALRAAGRLPVRSPWWVRYGWAVALTGLVLSELLLSCDRPLSEPVRMALEAAGLDRVACPGDDSRPVPRPPATAPESPSEAVR
jgi:hypothetical protein